MIKSGIYAIDLPRRDRRYVGSASNIANRWTVHRYHLRRGTHHSVHLQRAWKKYGEQAFRFVILQYCQIEQLAAREQYYMDLVPAKSRMNCHPTARSTHGYHMSECTKQKIRLSALRVAADPKERQRRSKRAKRQWAEGRLGRKRRPIKSRNCASCCTNFTPIRLPNGCISGTKWCDGCRPPHRGGRYKTAKHW
jgi:group I intron endonuclease